MIRIWASNTRSFHAGARKNDFNPHFPVSKEAQTWAQAEVDRVYEIFVAAVARNRRLDAEAVRATEAGLFFGPQAVEAGLADGVASFEETLEALEAEVNTQSAIPGGAMAAGQDSAINKEEKVMEVTDQEKRPAAETPDAGAQAPDVEGAKAQAAQKAQERIKAVLSLPEAKGREDLAKELAFETDLTPEAAAKILAAAPQAQANPLAQAMSKRAQPRGGRGRRRRRA